MSIPANIKKNRDEDRGLDTFNAHLMRTVESPDEPSTTAVLYLSDEEPRSGPQRVSKRMVHNEVERRRKSKINTFIYRLADLLPLVNGRKLSKNDILEKAVEYIKEIKDDLHNALEGHLNEAQVSEYKRLQKRIIDLEQTNTAYANLLQIAGIPLNADPATVWPPNTKYSNKIDPDSASCQEKNLKDTKREIHDSNPETNKTLEVVSTIVSTSAPVYLAHSAAPTAVYETLVSHSTNGVTAVTQSLPGAPIMSTAPTAQQLVPQFPQLLNLGGMVNFVSGMPTIQGHTTQSVLLFNDQGVPILQTGPQNVVLSAGQQQQQQFRFFGSPATQAPAAGHHQHQQPSILQPGSVVLGHNANPSCHQTVTGTTNQLPSALVLPNGQVIPVVSQPSILYPNTGSIGGSLIVTTPTAATQSPCAMEQQQPQPQTQNICSSPAVFIGQNRSSVVTFSPESTGSPVLVTPKPCSQQNATVSRPSEATQSAAISSSSAAHGGVVDGNRLQSGDQMDPHARQVNNKRGSSNRTQRAPKGQSAGCKRSRASKSSPKPTPPTPVTMEQPSKPQVTSRPVSALKDILAKATESIFDFEVEAEGENNAEKQTEVALPVEPTREPTREKDDCEIQIFPEVPEGSEGNTSQHDTTKGSTTESDILSDLVADVYREDVQAAQRTSSCDRDLTPSQEKPNDPPVTSHKDIDLGAALSPKTRREFEDHVSGMQEQKKQRTETLSVTLSTPASNKDTVAASRDTTSFMSVSQLACSASLVTSSSTIVSSTSATFSNAATVPSSCLMDVAVSSDSSPFGSISPLLTSPGGNKGVTGELSFMNQPMPEDANNFPPYSCTAFSSTPPTSSAITTATTVSAASFGIPELSFGDALNPVSVVSEHKSSSTTSVVFSNVHNAPQMCHPFSVVNTQNNTCVAGHHSPRAHIPVQVSPSAQRPPSSNNRPSLPSDIQKSQPNIFLTSSHSINALVPSVDTMANHSNHNPPPPPHHHHHHPAHPTHHDSSISPKLGHHPHHIAMSPAARNPPLPTPPHSSPAPFVPRHSPEISTSVPQPQETVSLMGVDAFRDIGYPVHRKQAPQQRAKAPVGNGNNNNNNSSTSNSNSNNNNLHHVSRSAPISYSAESLIRTQTQQRSHCAREVHGSLQQTLGPMTPSVPSLVSQQSRNPQRDSSASSNFHYFPFPSHSHTQMEHSIGGPGSTQPHLNHLLPPVNPGTAPSSTHRAQPNFTFGHGQSAVSSNDVLQEEPPHLGFGQMGYSNYGSGGAQKDGMSRHQTFMGVHGMTPCSSGGQTSGHHVHHHHHPGVDAGFSGGTFPDLYGSIGVARSDGANAAAAMAANASKSKKPENQSSSRVPKSNKQSTAAKKKHQQQQQQQQAQQNVPQTAVEEINLSNSIFETGRGGGTPYFSVPSLSPPRNDGPTYLPAPNSLFNGSQRHSGPSSASSMVQVHHQSKPSDLGPQSAYNALLAPRTQTGLNLNFQAPSFRVNHMHGNVPNHITPQQPPQHANVPNFNLSNIFPDMNNASSDGLNISPIKFHTGNHHILPPPPPAPQPPVDPNTLQHAQTGPLYHNRPHGHPPPPPPPAVLHNGMSINSLLGHNPHGFDGRPQVQVPMAINNGVAPPPFHGHGHSSTFGNMLTTLNFTAHDH